MSDGCGKAAPALIRRLSDDQDHPSQQARTVPAQRAANADGQADLELKADIEARGLLQNLVVTSALKPKGSFAVEAGGRRLRALQALVGEGKIEKTHEICCLVLEGGPAEAQEASLAENSSGSP